jgi:hypothetical protein
LTKEPRNNTELSRLLEALRAELHERYSELRAGVAVWFAYAILYNPKYRISHDLDPPWDNSGQLYIRSMSRSDIHYLTPGSTDQEGFDLDQYERLNGFLEEYTGQNRASYVSGCGLFYETYDEALSEFIQEWVTSIFVEVFSQKPNRDALLAISELADIDTSSAVTNDKDLYWLLDDVDSRLDNEYFSMLQLDIVDEFLSTVREEPTTRLFEDGLLGARRQREQKIEVTERARQKEEEIEQRAKRLLEEMQSFIASSGILFLNSNKFGYQTIGKRSEIWKILKPWITQLMDEDRKALLRYGPFSNSIKEEKY